MPKFSWGGLVSTGRHWGGPPLTNLELTSQLPAQNASPLLPEHIAKERVSGQDDSAMGSLQVLSPPSVRQHLTKTGANAQSPQRASSAKCALPRLPPEQSSHIVCII